MKFYTLHHPGALDPLWFNQVRHGHHAAYVGDDGAVELDGVRLTFVNDVLPASTKVDVWLTGNFVCAPVASLLADREARLQQECADREAARQRRDTARADAEAFNASIKLPVRWDVGQKDVLSGLSANSWGDGRNKATVGHIFLLEPLEAGRLARAAGDFLCSSNATQNGKRWSSIVLRSRDGEDQEYAPRVTCKTCLKLAQRWMEVLDGQTPER